MFSVLGKVRVGENYPVRIMGAINLSPESFYKGSVVTSQKKLEETAQMMISSGADFLDIGAFSTAPYLETEISEEKEIERIEWALKIIKKIDKNISVSVDTFRARVAERAMSLGAEIINDVTGLKGDDKMCSVLKEYNASLIIMAFDPLGKEKERPISRILNSLLKSLRIAEMQGLERKKIVVDPGIGFFREKGRGPAFSKQTLMPWYIWDMHVINKLDRLKKIGLPVAISLSRKSFIGKVLGKERAEERLFGSIAATAIAVERGAKLVRTHDVEETLHAVRITEAILSC
jgi:dihydropteroate synthase